MAEAKNSFIKSKMNKDLDDRLIPNNEYRDALNVAVSRSEGSDVGALEAILGNSIVIDSSVTGEEIIGVLEDHTNGLAYYFTTDFTSSPSQPKAALTNTCTISVYNAIGETTTVLVSGSFLNFSKTSRMNGVSLIENLLFFNDNRNQPRKINVSNPLGYYTNEDQISVAKFAPYKAAEFINLRSTSTLKPSTMSNASDPIQTEIASETFSAINLDASKYKNGDVILQAADSAAWIAANSAGTGAWCYYDNSLANGVTYGKLYNRHAVLDSRGIAPNGFTIMNAADWVTVKGSTPSTAATRIKSLNLWDANPGTNTTGFSLLPSGWRDTTGAFAGTTTKGAYWTSETSTSTWIETLSTDQLVTTGTTAPGFDDGNGYAVRLKRNSGYNGWNGDPDYLADRFVKFSYRFRFNDNEYSVIAPFSQDVFIPKQEGQFLNENETQAFVTTVVEFMQNSVNNAVLNIPLPSLDILNDYKIKGIDIVFKQSDAQAYQILETIRVNDSFIQRLNNTNIFQYDYQSTTPIKTLPSSEASRVYDKVPVRAIAQETAGNRIMYGNFVQGKSGQKGLDYYVDVIQKNNQIFTEYPQHSLKQNRNYQVGIILADKFGRQTDIILSNYDNTLDANGDPQPGSNVFSDYNSVGFNSSIPSWQGDTLQLNFNSLIPEAPLANGVSGYPGAYAVGDYYTIQKVAGSPETAPDSVYFRDYSTQELTSTAAQTVFGFTGILSSEVVTAGNSYNVYKNTGLGWVKVPTTDYAVNTSGSYPIATLTTGALLGDIVKFELLFTTNNYYKYITGTTDAAKPLFPNFPTTATTVFAVGKSLSAEYTDYTEIESNLMVGVLGIQIFTKDEVARKYLFDNVTGSTRPEPPLLITDLPRSYAAYTINVDGFYSYRVGIKQQQQDYYNVYLPGIINGYPIKGEIKERGETAFTTLISDNINKIPRNLNDVGPLQNQFTSNVTLFGRVTNTVSSTTGTPAVTYRTTQFDPLSSADDVNLVGTVKDIFPDSIDTTGTPVAGDVNPFTIYDYNTQPYIAKISTQKTIGLTEDLYLAPAGTPPPYPYPDEMGLAVYETSPYTSALEIFYEATTTGLISDLNYEVQNISTGINGIGVTSATFDEDYASGTRITADFFPLSGGLIDNTATAVMSSAFNFAYGTSNLNSINYALSPNQRFSLQPGSQTGSYFIQTVGTFYAGSNAENAGGFDTQYSGNYQVTIQFTEASGNTVDQTIDLQLVNSRPTANGGISPSMTGTPANETIFTVLNSPNGYNGSAANPSVAGVPSGGNWGTFIPGSGFGWSVESVTVTPLVGPVVVYQGVDTINAVKITRQTTDTPANGGSLRFDMRSVNGVGNTPGSSYVILMQLTDTNGLQVASPVTVSYSVGASTFNTVVGSYYQSGTGYTSGSSTNMQTSTGFTISGFSEFPRWIGQIQNWTTGDIYIHARLRSNSINSGFNVRVGNTINAETWATGKIGGWLNGVVNNDLWDADRLTCPASTTSGGQTYWSGSIAVLDGFNANQTLINSGVRPGQTNNGSGSLPAYDFSQSALVNLAFSVEGGAPANSDNFPPSSSRNAMLPSLNGATVDLFWSTSSTSPGVPPASYTALQLTMNAPTLPFFPATINGSDYSVSPTAASSTAAQGPS